MLCKKCEAYKQKVQKYKQKYEIAKSGLTSNEREILIALIGNEQIKHLLNNDKYESDEYKLLEQLKAKLRIV